MIRYPITLRDLETQLEAEKPGWLARAGTRTAKFLGLGYYNEKSSIWSEVKAVYLRLQGGSKCAYCERKLEAVDYGKVEQDVEHFRPKGRVKEWRLTKALKSVGIVVTKVPRSLTGYYLLPYHPFNYSASCKPCNSALKKNYFPISGSYNCSGDDPSILLSEAPFLIYPIGDFDDDPEDLIYFHGTSPLPVAPRGHAQYRALVTIEFFKLDDAIRRKNLFLERAFIIVAMYPQLEKLATATSANERARAHSLIDAYSAPHRPHTNCARSFRRLYNSDPAEAEALFHGALALVCSSS